MFLVDETLLFQTGVAAGVANAKAVAVAKTSATFGTTVVRGLLCNWLVSIVCCSTGAWYLRQRQTAEGAVQH